MRNQCYLCVARFAAGIEIKSDAYRATTDQQSNSNKQSRWRPDSQTSFIDAASVLQSSLLVQKPEGYISLDDVCKVGQYRITSITKPKDRVTRSASWRLHQIVPSVSFLIDWSLWQIFERLTCEVEFITLHSTPFLWQKSHGRLSLHFAFLIKHRRHAFLTFLLFLGFIASFSSTLALDAFASCRTVDFIIVE